MKLFFAFFEMKKETDLSDTFLISHNFIYFIKSSMKTVHKDFYLKIGIFSDPQTLKV